MPLHVAYLSWDFRDHPTAYMIEGAMHGHASRALAGAGAVKSILVHYGPMDGSSTGKRLQMISESNGDWLDATELSDEEVIESLDKLGTHIAIDLQGPTFGQRQSLFARRIAAVQAVHLIFPGTTGLD